MADRGKPPTKPPGSAASPPAPQTTRRAEVEQARRTPAVQAARARVKGFPSDDQTIRLLAEAIRQLLRKP